MINFLYQLTNKGSWRTLSFLLAIALTLCFFFNIQQFASQLRTVNPIIVLVILWSVVINWIHGIGFEICLALWRVVFLPIIGLIVGTLALVYGLF
ncbi:cyd operon protein YbgE [Volucribacter amazonae]|uniref:Cytochrome bd biosynthesis protein n=1 Tax=Volucribacter amazonae TaxID=256731 RepID=A0A9X4PCY1_9PAST|nr:cyd operon protein YbgE [Volucribacter amazonae]MDG6895877.1 cytochrome bd biosynthesis protein [Volucribacter amazonae]